MIAITNARLVSLSDETILPDHTVLIDGERIAAVGPAADLALPDTAERIDATGLFLMPALADMHVHLESESDLPLFLAAGVTTVRNMRGTPRHLAWRDAIRRGELAGPAIVTCGPILDGKPPSAQDAVVIETAEDAERAVMEQKAAGYDFIKIYDNLSLPAYEAIMAAARRHGMPVTGHVSRAVRLRRTLLSGQSCIEHLSGYVDSIESADSPFRGKWNWRKTWHAVEADDARIARAAEATRQAGVWNCPTLTVFKGLAQRSDRPGIEEAARQGEAVRARLVRALRDAGARLLLGTDSPNGDLTPGASVCAELRNLVEAGLTPCEALRTATTAPAEFLGGDFGAIAPGKLADLLLLRDNPLLDVGAVARPNRVMVRGMWI